MSKEHEKKGLHSPFPVCVTLNTKCLINLVVEKKFFLNIMWFQSY